MRKLDIGGVSEPDTCLAPALLTTRCDTLDTDLIDHGACVWLQLENRPENVAVVRAALSGVAEAAELGSEVTADVLTAVSEACNNAVLHAYGGDRGPMRVVISSNGELVDVVVADDGSGIRRISTSAGHMGLGLPLISALADHAVFHSPRLAGTEVRMRFRTLQADGQPVTAAGPGAASAPAAEPGFPEGAWPGSPLASTGSAIVMRVEPVAMARHLVGRVARAAASASHFTIAGAADLYAINDAVAGLAEAAANGHLEVTIETAPHLLTLHAGPIVGLPCDHGVAGRRPAGAGPRAGWTSSGHGALDDHRLALAGLVHQMSVEPCDGGELLRLELVDRGRAPVA